MSPETTSEQEPATPEKESASEQEAATPDRIEVRVNGEERRIPRGRTVEELLEGLELDPRAVVVEVNREIVRREEIGDVTLEPGDRVEIVQFVGGG